MKELLFLASSILFCQNISFAQTQANSVNDATNAYDNKGTKSFERIEKSGKFYGCDLHYNYTYLDYKNKKGALILVSGVVSTAVPGRPVFVLVQSVKTSEITLSKSGQYSAKDFSPAYFGLSIGAKNIDKYQAPLPQCRPGTLCKGFLDDSDASLLLYVLNNTYQPMEVVVTTVKDGIDKQINLDALNELDKSKPITYDSKLEFFSCISDIVKTISNEPAK